MHRPISRRTLLQGVGVALALPWMESMFPAVARGAETLSAPPLRSAFLFVPNGVVPQNWTPTGDDESWEATPMLKPVAHLKDDFLLLENLFHKETKGRNGHWPKVPAWLSGGFVVRTAGRDMDTGNISVDQLMAHQVGHQTPLPSLELGVDAAYTGVDNVGGGFTRIYGSHIAWRDPHTPVPKEIIPQLAFDRLFRTGPSRPVISGFHPNQKEVNKSLQRDDASVLDLVMEDAKALERRISSQDREKLDEYLESVRSIETRMDNALKPQKRWINSGRFDVPRPGQGIPEVHQEHVRLMLDIMVLAFWTDTTRISTFMLGNAQTGRNFGFLDGVNGSYHGLSHHRDEIKKRDQYERIGTWHVEQLAYVLQRMKSLKEADGTLLDHSMLLYGSSLKDGNRHDHHDLPLILAGRGNGLLRPGRRLRSEKDTPMCNLLLSMANAMGVSTDKFGDSTGVMKGLS